MFVEDFDDLPDQLMRKAFLDPQMTDRNQAGALFPTDRFDIRLGGQGSINSNAGKFTLPFGKIIITIDLPVMVQEDSFMGPDPITGGRVVDVEANVSFSVWTDNIAQQSETLQRLNFARDARQNVFSLNRITMMDRTIGNLKAYQSPQGFWRADYEWYFRYYRDGIS